jgi:glycosyltransferase involved in cell wall biosynthesis
MPIRYNGVPERAFKNFFSKATFSVLRRLTYTNLLYTKDFNVSRQYSPILQKKINEVLKKERFDLIYSDYSTSSYLLYFKRKDRIKAPVVLEFFSPTLYAQRRFLRYGSFRDKILAFLTYLSFRFLEVKRYGLFEAGIYVSKTHLELSKPFLPKQTFVIPPGVDLEFFRPQPIDSTSPTIIFSGGMNYLPNVASVLHFYSKIYPYIKRELPNVKFYVVGREPDNRIKKLSFDPSVIVTGSVNDVRPYFAASEVFVNPIIIDDGGIKNKVLEAMAMGKAVVSTPLGARDIGATDYENIVIARNDREFAEKVVELLKDEKERRRIGNNARKFVEENYSWRKQSKMLYNVFKELVEGNFDELH